MIKLNEVINENMVLLDLSVENKEEVINKLVDIMDKEGKLSSRNEFLKSVLDREELLSTYCGSNIAIPHGISDSVKEPGICFARTKEIYWGSPKEEVHFVFLLAVPKSGNNKNSPHLKLLSAIAISSLEEGNREIWEKAETNEEILKSLRPAIKEIESDPE